MGQRFNLCRRLKLVHLCRFCHRRLCSPDRGLTRQHFGACRSLDALEQAVYECRPGEGDGVGMVHHSGKEPHYLSIRYSERLAEAEIEPSMGQRR